MRIYANPTEALRETERDLWEMGITTHPASMQSKRVVGNEDYATKELRAYGFQMSGRGLLSMTDIRGLIAYLFPKDQVESVFNYIQREFTDRFQSATPSNPGNSFRARPDIWNEFLRPDGTFHYTYSERIVPQFVAVIDRLKSDLDSRQGIIQIFDALDRVSRYKNADTSEREYRWELGQDQLFASGVGRIPCSMYYQLMVREGKLDLIYTMRSCDFLTHFVVDFVLAMLLQDLAATIVGAQIGTFTYFTGSLHAYQKDMRVRGIF